MTEINLINGDCLEQLKKLPDNSVDCIITDPPYKVSQNYGSGVDADNLSNVSSILRTLPEMCRVLKEGRFLVCFYDNRILPFLFEAIKGTELVYRKSIYLYRRWGVAHRWMGWMQCTDPVCFFVKGHNKPFYQNKIKGKVKHDCYIKAKPEKENTGHPAQKPVEIIEDLITWCSAEGDAILDPYLGSGSVAVACKKLKRKCIGIEIEQDYIKMVKERLDNFVIEERKLSQETLTSSDSTHNTKQNKPCEVNADSSHALKSMSIQPTIL